MGTKKQTAAIVGAVVAAAVIVPSAAFAATGTLANITDPVNSAEMARVSGGRLQVASVDANLNALLFRTTAGAVSMAAGTSRSVANVNTAGYRKLRIVADERTGSVSNVSFRVTILEGSELVAQLATFTLTPHSERTFTIDVPPRAVAIYADAASGSGSDAFDFLVYGSK
jgi:hypothetical protein